MVNLEAKNINIMINIILDMILIDIGQYWFQIDRDIDHDIGQY